MKTTSTRQAGLVLAIAGAGFLPAVEGCGEGYSTPPGRPIQTATPVSQPDRAAPEGVRDVRPPAAKPVSPIALEFVAESPPAVDAPARLLLAVTPSIDLPDCVVTVVLPDGLALADGSLTWRGAIGRNQRQTLTLGIRVPDDRRYEIVASARSVFEGGTVLTRSATFVLNAGAVPAKPTVTPGVLKINSRGEPIQELPGGDPK